MGQAAILNGNEKDGKADSLHIIGPAARTPDDRMTDDDEEIFWLTAGYMVGAGRLITEDDHGMEDTDWIPSTIESD